MSGAQADLRQATLDVHERLHEAEPFKMIAEGRLEMSTYRRLLRAILHFHSSVQPILAAHPQTADLGGGLDRVERLECDLRHVGAAGPSPCPASPAFDGHEAIGCLYVVQGSTLGGRVIYRQLDYLLDGAEGRSFFLGGSDDSARWQKVRALLEKQPPERRDSLRRGASRTFTLFEECLASEVCKPA